MKKALEYIKNYFSFDTIVFFICLILPDILLRIIIHFSFGKLPLFRDLCIAFIIACLCYLIPNKKVRHIIEFICVIIISLYCFAQVVHVRFFDTVFSFKKLVVVNELFGVTSEIGGKISYKDALFLVPPLLMFLGNKLDNKKSIRKENSLIVYILVIVLCIFVGVFGQKVFISQLKQDQDDWEGDDYLYMNMQNKNRYFSRFGVFDYIYRDIKTIVTTNAHSELTDEEKEEIEAFISKHNYNDSNEMTGVFEGKNLILILAESFYQSAIDEELTPTLYRLSNEGYYFNNYYAPIYLNATGDSEFISQTSMLPSINFGATSYTYHKNSYPYSLANLFIGKDYLANSYHAYIAEFYNRELFHESLGFTTFYDYEKLSLNFWDGYYKGTNWILDKDMFSSMMDHTDTSKPFYNFAISVTGHMPYVEMRVELQDNLEIINKTKYSNLDSESKCYLAAQMNFDQGIEELLKQLEEKGVLENTVIAIYGDHYPYGIEGENGKNEIIKYTDYQKYHVPFLIYDGSGKYGNEQINTLGCTFDIYPTICNLFNLDYDGAYTVGSDLFGDNERRVLFMDHSVLTEDFYYDSSTSEYIITSENYDSEKATMIMQDSEDIYDYGQKILMSDFYRWR